MALTSTQQAILQGATAVPQGPSFTGQGEKLAKAFGGGNVTAGEFIRGQGMERNPLLPMYGAQGYGGGLPNTGGQLALPPSIPTPGAPVNVIPGSGEVITGGVSRAAPSVLASEVPLAEQILAQGAQGAGAATTAASTLTSEAAPVIAGGEEAILAGAGGNALKTGLLSGLSKGSVIKGAGVGIAAQIISGLVGSQNFGGENSNLDQALTGGIQGAGIGGGLALALGASGPVGWAAAAGGFLLDAVFSAQEEGGTTEERMQKSVTKTTNTIQQMGQQYGLDPSDMADILLQHNATTQLFLNNKDKKGLDAYLSQLPTALPAMMVQYKQQRDQEAQHNQRVMAMQGAFAPIFNSIAQRSSQDNQVAYQNAVYAADQLATTNPQLASLIKANASTANQSSDAIMAAYAAQLATAPNQLDSQQYYQGQNLLQQYTMPGTTQIQAGNPALSQSQQRQYAQLAALQGLQG